MRKFVMVFALWGLAPIGHALAGSDLIMVSMTKAKTCLPPEDAERVVYLLTPTETLSAIAKHFESAPHAFGGAITNANIKFCTAKDRQRVLRGIIDAFDVPQTNARMLEVGANYYGHAEMRSYLKARLSDRASSAQLKKNLHALVDFTKARQQ